jgi:predicted transcriptional regulator
VGVTGVGGATRRICGTFFEMKTATLPSLRVEPAFRAEVESVLSEGETLSEFVEAAVRDEVRRRRIQNAFIARGLQARDHARLSDDYVSADAVLQGLRRSLDVARSANSAA